MNSINTEAKILEPKKQLNLYGYNRYFDFFSKVLEKNKIPNALLFSGPKGIGKSTFAYHIINHILSKNENNKYSIENFTISEENLSYKLIDSNTHPNFFLIDNNINENEIKIDQIRTLKKFLNKTTYSTNRKIILIDNAENLNLNSSNALLKAIEEPASNVFFFIVHDSAYKIMDTIRSRCIEFKFHFNISEKKNILEKIINQYDSNLDIKSLFQYLYFDTPGNLIKYNSILSNENLKLSDDFLDSILFFIDKCKNTKDKESLPILKTLIEKFYNDLCLSDNTNINNYFFNKLKVLELLNNMKKYNLDKKNVLIIIEEILQNEKK